MAQSALKFLHTYPLAFAAIKILIVFLVLSGLVAYLVYLERKVLAFMQARLGPMRVGPWGLLQPIADGVKLLLKEDIIPAGADKWLFLLAPVINVVAAFSVFVAIPFGPGEFVISNPNIGLLFILGVSSLGIYGIVLGGWASNSHYPLLGALRSSAQLVSYEVAAGMALVGPLLLANSLSMVEMVKSQQGLWHLGGMNTAFPHWNVFAQPVAFIIYLIAAVAETNRNPFDLPEAESELTAGFHTEYSGFRFSLYFLAEYTNMVLVSAIAVTVFWGGWLRPFEGVAALDPYLKRAPVLALILAALFVFLLGRKSAVPKERVFFMVLVAACMALAVIVAFPPVLETVQGVFWFLAKVLVFLYGFIWYRGTFPRYRFDQLMNLGWRYMIPLALANLIVTAVVRWFWITSHPAAPTVARIISK